MARFQICQNIVSGTFGIESFQLLQKIIKSLKHALQLSISKSGTGIHLCDQKQSLLNKEFMIKHFISIPHGFGELMVSAMMRPW